MEQLVSIKPLLAVGVSIAVIPLLVSSRWANLREGWTFAAAAIKFALVVSMVPAVLSGRVLTFDLIEVLPGLPIAFAVDPLGLLFALVSSSLWIVTSAYSIGYMRGLNEHSQTRYFSYFALALSATVGVAFSANLLTMYLFYEMLSLATYPLMAHHQDAEARSAGRKYLLYILGTSIGLVLPAMLIIYQQAGTLAFSPEGIIPVGGGLSKTHLTILVFMLFFGFAKAAIMPLHSWLPAAMVAPTPVSALLHAVAVVKVGAFSVVRVLTGVFGVGLLSDLDLGVALAAVASVTIIASSLIALTQDELKRRLAFSTIGQLSYIVLGVALLSPTGLIGGVLHIAMHAFGKITLFFCAGAIYVATGRKYISQMTGVGRRMPVTMTAFLLGSLSVIGLPPLGGFLSKWNLLLGSLDSGHMVFVVVLLGSSFLNAAYFLPIVYRAFFSAPLDNQFGERVGEAPLWCVVPLVITALISAALFFYPEPFIGLAELAASGFFGG